VGKIDKRDYQKRLDRITALFSDMVVQADAQSRQRCPYRDRHDRCTAAFRCRNRTPPERHDGSAGDELAGCGHDGGFDYRDAWETDPAAYRRAKDKLSQVKRAATKRRGSS
jgi:hypothetical protein